MQFTRRQKLDPFLQQTRMITLGIPSFPDSRDDRESATDSDDVKQQSQSTSGRVLESALTTFASLALLGLSGYSYHKYYKWLVLHKIENSFTEGDPALLFHHNTYFLDTSSDRSNSEIRQYQFVVRDEQAEIDEIVHGNRSGSYYLIIGEKGNGKKGMLLNAMHKNYGLNTSIMEAHSDLEIFRLRLGKTLDYEFTEDFVGSLFSIKGQRDATPILDIERAFNKLEKVAIKHKVQRGSDHKPLVMIFNNMHLIQDDKDGNALLELLQQRAESFASSGLMTFIFNSDEYWIYERMKQNGRRMELLPITDLPKAQALKAFADYRARLFGVFPTDEELESIWQKIGGRLSFLAKVARSSNMMARADAFLQQEKTWVLNQSALIPDFDDDVLEDGKWQGGTFMMAKALVEEELANPEKWKDELVYIPLYRCRQILTRADFMQRLDNLNIISVDTDSNVRADNRCMQQAFREIVAEEDFEDQLNNVLDRCSAVESLNRTRELIFKAIENPDGTPNETGQGGIVKVQYEKLPQSVRNTELNHIDADSDSDDNDDDDDPFHIVSQRED
ncbi:protein of unknown function [Taphrina deformans PYCC 5710]|uniref:AAA protein C-terminal winged helix domain-containing protein n=1 Tax=Taphrina deformans (strain PYCC 5710 / ATCC 11124 / CBS 356.35 / IMI 108563 / JCM 9778 / NBRC 8474) TaxID=1097556 RepID=R4XES8_TAPDE|nr:protein of unknown function [Taphrina deformans PYCC 5710]|eukprot:CCG84362.1 protein of unknown function [Taphrina deformans PYCC 5710]